MKSDDEKLTLGEKFLRAEQDAAFHYGSQMIKFAKAYSMLMTMVGFLPENLELSTGYPEDLEISFSQLPDQPERWKEIYQIFRRHGWERKAPAIIQGTKMELHLFKDNTEISIDVSFPLCSVEKIGTKMVEQPIYKISCEGPKLVDPEPGVVLVNSPVENIPETEVTQTEAPTKSEANDMPF